MTDRYPPQQPYGQPYQGQAFAGGPGYPPPPKKKMSGGAIVAIVLGSVFGGLFILLVIIGLAVDDDSTQAEGKSPILEVTAPADESATAAPAKPAEKTPEKAAEKPEPKKDPEYSSGDWVVGEDIPAGTYTSAGAEKGIFELCTITTDPSGDTTMPKIKTANADERVIITLAEEDGVVSISGCEPLKPRE
ncbi:hypothetical protein [Streptomyces pratensis]|uniref:hypothetical protein n=1 Tax=Streptomyces pratensis TaxID=1169025 RepID=UPI0036381E8F